MVSYTPSKILGVKIGKQIEERSMEELLGSSFKEFVDSDRYLTTISKNLNTLVFKATFTDRWKVSAKYTNVLKVEICNQEFPENLTLQTNAKDCLELL